MLREAELFVMAERMTVEVRGRIGPENHHIRVPSWSTTPGSVAPTSLRQLLNEAVQDDLRLPVLLVDGRVEAAVDPGAAVDGDLSTRDVLARATVTRSLLAHYVAAYLGPTACPLPEELASPLWKLTAPDADRWRSLGVFGEPMPLPDHVSWRDWFLLTASHPPHPPGH